jgi:hypothetical protein
MAMASGGRAGTACSNGLCNPFVHLFRPCTCPLGVVKIQGFFKIKKVISIEMGLMVATQGRAQSTCEANRSESLGLLCEVRDDRITDALSSSAISGPLSEASRVCSAFRASESRGSFPLLSSSLPCPPPPLPSQLPSLVLRPQ